MFQLSTIPLERTSEDNIVKREKEDCIIPPFLLLDNGFASRWSFRRSFFLLLFPCPVSPLSPFYFSVAAVLGF